MARTFYGPYAMDYLKSKRLKIWRLRDPGEPYKHVLGRNGDFVMGDDGTPKRTLDFTDSIIIHDTFGVYQKRFTSVSKSLRDQGYLAPCDHETIVEQKDNRSNFDKTPLQTIKEYTRLELIGLSKSLTVLRDGFDKMGIRLPAWSGAGAASAAEHVYSSTYCKRWKVRVRSPRLEV